MQLPVDATAPTLPPPPTMTISSPPHLLPNEAGPSGSRVSSRCAPASSASRIASDSQPSTTTSNIPRPPSIQALNSDINHADIGALGGGQANFQATYNPSSGIASASSLGLPHRPKPPRRPAKTLSITIPPGAEAYGGLSAPPTSSSSSSSSTVSPRLQSAATRLPSSGHAASSVSTSAVKDLPMLLPTPTASFASQSGSLRLTSTPRGNRKRPVRLNLEAANGPYDAVEAKSVPCSPHGSKGRVELDGKSRLGLSTITVKKKHDLRLTLTGKPRRRPSMPFGKQFNHSREDGASSVATPVSGGFHSANRPPEAWRDPSEHILSGKGSTLQHARSVYAAGPIEVLPGLFLGDEHNARDDEMLAEFGITTILNVAKETVLPFQSDKGVTDLRQNRPGEAPTARRYRHPEKDGSDHRHPSHRPAMPMRAVSLSTAEMEGGSPVTPDFEDALQTPATANDCLHGSIVAGSSSGFTDVHEPITPMQRSPTEEQQEQSSDGPYLRSTSSTPNLQALAQDAGQLMQKAGTGEQTSVQIEPPTSAKPDTLVDPEVAADARVIEPGAEDASSSLMLTTEVELAPDAITLTIPPSPLSGRPQAIRYIKLPWTHDQTELAAPGGGFAQGCAVIADAMGIDYYGRPLLDEHQQAVSPSNILVHCQCGVSRSATLVIAFVMQAAALNYPWDTSKNLTGMHDCYNLVKELSASISPNISLIYQLVEWERHLSAEAARLREALKAQSPEAALIGLSGEPNAGQGGWSSEVLDEEEWTRMRKEEEAKEQAEEQSRRQRVLEEAKRQAEQRKSVKPAVLPNGIEPQDIIGHPVSANDGLTPKGLSARRQKKAPALRLGGNPVSGSSVPSSNGAMGLPPSSLPKSPSLSVTQQGSGRDPLLRVSADAGNIPSALKSGELQGTSGLHKTHHLPADLGSDPHGPNGISVSGPQSNREQKALKPPRYTDPFSSTDSLDRAELPSVVYEPVFSPTTPGSRGISPSGPTSEILRPSARPLRPHSADMSAVVPSAASDTQLSSSPPKRPGLPARHGSTGMQHSLSQGGGGSNITRRSSHQSHSLRGLSHAPVSFHPASRARGHGTSSSISSLQSIHASLSGSSGMPTSNSFTSGLVSPKANFGTALGLTSAERKQQHRRTFSSEANNAAGLINWEQVRSAVMSTREEMKQRSGSAVADGQPGK